MRKKSEAQQLLESVEMIDAIVENKLIEQRQWKDLALGITANMDGERVQSSGSTSKMADALAKAIDMESEIDGAVDKLIDTKREVLHIIEQLSSPTEYKVLHKRYIQFKALWQIAEDYDRDYGWVTTTHGRALKSVQAILDARYNSAEAAKTIIAFQKQCEEVANKKLKAELDSINKKGES